MPKEKASVWGMLRRDEPGPIARLLHNLSGRGEGDWGEACIAALLRNRVKGASIFRNAYIPTKGGTTELDLVLVEPRGVFVFESKAYGGTISGTPEQLNWTQILGNTENAFYNPIRQNKNHCLHLARALRVSNSTVFSFVVFENRTDLTEVSLRTGKDFVLCNRRDLAWFLAKVLASRRPVFTSNQLAQICARLSEWSAADAAVKARHIQQVQDIRTGSRCPVCGRPLTKQKDKHGTFLGCSGYPDCTYTREL